MTFLEFSDRLSKTEVFEFTFCVKEEVVWPILEAVDAFLLFPNFTSKIEARRHLVEDQTVDRSVNEGGSTIDLFCFEIH